MGMDYSYTYLNDYKYFSSMTQQQKILNILKIKGLNSYEYRMQFIQLPVRIKELKARGYNIISRPEKNRSVTYILSPKVVGPPPGQQNKPNPWEEELVRVEKNGRIFWEKPEEPKQQELDI